MRKFRTLSILFVVLAAAYLLSRVPPPSSRPRSPAVPEEVQRISLDSPGLSVTLERAGEGWRLKSPVDVPANEGNVLRLLSSLRSLTLENVLSRRPESFGLYQVDDASGVRVRVWGTGAKEPAAWVVGKDSPTGDRGYVRVANGPEVYLAKGLPRSLVGAGLGTWRDGRLLPLAADDVIQSVRVRRKEGTLVLVRSSDAWTVDGKPADRDALEHWTTALRYASADDYLDPPRSLAPAAALRSSPTTEVIVVLSAGPSHTLRFGAPETGDGARVLAGRDGDPHLFWVTANGVDFLNVSHKDLLSK